VPQDKYQDMVSTEQMKIGEKERGVCTNKHEIMYNSVLEIPNVESIMKLKLK
jgi:hypothetical protein